MRLKVCCLPIAMAIHIRDSEPNETSWSHSKHLHLSNNGHDTEQDIRRCGTCLMRDGMRMRMWSTRMVPCANGGSQRNFIRIEKASQWSTVCVCVCVCVCVWVSEYVRMGNEKAGHQNGSSNSRRSTAFGLIWIRDEVVKVIQSGSNKMILRQCHENAEFE